MTTGGKRKDSPQVKSDNSKARKKRVPTSSHSTPARACPACGSIEHGSVRSRDCPHHDFTLAERLSMAFPNGHERYTISIPLQSFLAFEGDPPDNNSTRFQERIITLSSFLKRFTYNAQILVNYYIMFNRNPANMGDVMFEQKFWYTVCRFIFQAITIEQIENKYPILTGFSASYRHLVQNLGYIGNLHVPLEGLVGYGHIVSTACETLAKTYVNFYLENYDSYVANYYIFRIKITFPVRKTFAFKN